MGRGNRILRYLVRYCDLNSKPVALSWTSLFREQWKGAKFSIMGRWQWKGAKFRTMGRGNGQYCITKSTNYRYLTIPNYTPMVHRLSNSPWALFLGALSGGKRRNIVLSWKSLFREQWKGAKFCTMGRGNGQHCITKIYKLRVLNYPKYTPTVHHLRNPPLDLFLGGIFRGKMHKIESRECPSGKKNQ